MSRIRNRRTGKWITLPDGDGLYHNSSGRTVTFEQIHCEAAAMYRGFDNLSLSDRNLLNYAPIGHGAGTANWRVALPRLRQKAKLGTIQYNPEDLGL